MTKRWTVSSPSRRKAILVSDSWWSLVLVEKKVLVLVVDPNLGRKRLSFEPTPVNEWIEPDLRRMTRPKMPRTRMEPPLLVPEAAGQSETSEP